MLKGKTVLLCVTGSIAAYKIAYLASALVKTKEPTVHVTYDRKRHQFHQSHYLRDADREQVPGGHL